MQLAKIHEAERRRRVQFAMTAGFGAEEIAELHEVDVRDVILDMAWLNERKLLKLTEERNVSDEVALEILQIEDDEQMLRRWIGETINLGYRIKLMDRLQKLRSLSEH